MLIARAHGVDLVEGRKRGEVWGRPSGSRTRRQFPPLEDSETVSDGRPGVRFRPQRIPPFSPWAASMLERASAAVALV